MKSILFSQGEINQICHFLKYALKTFKKEDIFVEFRRFIDISYSNGEINLWLSNVFFFQSFIFLGAFGFDFKSMDIFSFII